MKKCLMVTLLCIFTCLWNGNFMAQTQTPDQPCEPYWKKCDPSQIERCQPDTPKIRRSCDGRAYYHPIYIKPCPNPRLPCPQEDG